MSLDDHDIALVRAANPGPFTLSGTNTWIVGRDPAYVIDPGPALDEHVAAVVDAAARRGGVGGIALTHRHPDHADAVPALREATGAPVAAATGDADRWLADGDRFGPLTAIAAPGHAPDHLVYVSGRVGFTGDALLGEGSVFVVGQLREYLDALERLRAMDLDLLCPGHGEPVEDPDTRLSHHIAHRLDRERRLVEALDRGVRSVDALLDEVWSDAPDILRPAAAVTLEAHLGKLEDEGRLPRDVERPEVPAQLRAP